MELYVPRSLLSLPSSPTSQLLKIRVRVRAAAPNFFSATFKQHQPLFSTPPLGIMDCSSKSLTRASNNGSPTTPFSEIQETGESRIGQVKRVTNETNVFVKINLDGTGVADSKTGIPFLDHMLESKRDSVDRETMKGKRKAEDEDQIERPDAKSRGRKLGKYDEEFQKNTKIESEPYTRSYKDDRRSDDRLRSNRFDRWQEDEKVEEENKIQSLGEKHYESRRKDRDYDDRVGSKKESRDEENQMGRKHRRDEEEERESRRYEKDRHLESSKRFRYAESWSTERRYGDSRSSHRRYDNENRDNGRAKH